MTRFFLILGALACSALHAEVLNVPGGTPDPAAGSGAPYAAPPADRSHLPKRGSSMDSVRARYGDPVSIHGPIGDPPITRWVYNDFSVFFEYRHVINAVIPGKPPAIHHQDELRRRGG